MKKNSKTDKVQEKEFPGYPPYPASEDIYSKGEKLNYEDSEELEEVLGQTSILDTPPSLRKRKEDKEYKDDASTGDDLDVPGAELDNDQEDIGNEDEENNYYSIGGDNHEDLEEKNEDQIPL